MSSISSIGGGSSPWDIYARQSQSASDASATASTASTASTNGSTSTVPSTQTAQFAHRGHHHGGGGQKFDAALADQGVTGTKLSDLRSQIQSAVQDARSSGSDPRAAIDATLKNAGIDLDKFKQDLGTPPQGAAQQSTPATDGTTTDATASTSIGASTGASSIESLLQNSGIDPTQFKSSLQTLLSDPNSTAESFGSLFAGATKGSELDVAA